MTGIPIKIHHDLDIKMSRNVLRMVFMVFQWLRELHCNFPTPKLFTWTWIASQHKDGIPVLQYFADCIAIWYGFTLQPDQMNCNVTVNLTRIHLATSYEFVLQPRINLHGILVWLCIATPYELATSYEFTLQTSHGITLQP